MFDYHAPAQTPLSSRDSMRELSNYRSVNVCMYISVLVVVLTHPMLRLLLSKARGWKDLQKRSKPYLVGIHWTALAGFSQMSTHVPGFQ